MGKLLTKYIDYLSLERKLSDNTVQSYVRDIRQFQQYLDSMGAPDLCEVNRSVLITYVIHMQREGKATASIVRSIVSLRSFYNFAIMTGDIETDPTEGFETPKSEEHTVQVLTQEEVKRLLDLPRAVDFKGYRDKAMLELIYATGIKVSELINLKIDDVHLAESYIVCGNGTKRRAVPIGHMAVAAIDNYIEKARSRQLVESQAEELFLNLNGKQLTRQGFWKILKEYKNKANISADITPHTLRHTFAMHLLENGTDMEDVQVMLGNSSPTAANRYKRMLDEHLSDVYKKAHPRA